MPDDDNYRSRVTAATFLFEVDGVEIGWFMEVSGLEVTVETETVQEGGQNSFVHHLPGRMTWPNLRLKRGVTKQDTLLTWLNKSSGEQFAASGNKVARSTAALTLIGAAGERLRAWEFTGVMPVKWTGPTFAVASAEAAVEELELAHDGFRAKELT